MRSLILGFLLACVSSAFAESLETLAQTAEAQAAKIGAVEELTRFKTDVETSARKTTYGLCTGYRRLRFVFSPSEWGASSPTGRGQSALAPWARVYGHGLMAAFDQLSGRRAQYIQLLNESMFSLDYWFQSLYGLYLVRSNGFLEAAMGCLNTMDQAEINRFASAILFADSVGAVQSQAVALYGAGKLAGVLLSPASALVSALTARVSKTALVIGGVVVIPIAIDGFHEHMRELEASRDASLDVLRRTPELIADARRTERFLRLNHGYELLRRVLVARDSGTPRPDAEREFIAFLKQHLSRERIAAYETDLADIRSKDILNDAEKRYVLLFELLMPIAQAN